MHDIFQSRSKIRITQVTLWRFPGQYADVESGLHYNGFRTYNPQTGRYLERDPLSIMAGVNVYAYVGGNPVGGVDSWGLFNIYAHRLSDGRYNFTVNFPGWDGEVGDKVGNDQIVNKNRLINYFRKIMGYDPVYQEAVKGSAGVRGDVDGYFDRYKCGSYDPQLETLFVNMGYENALGAIASGSINEEQLINFLNEAKKILPQEVIDLYKFDGLVQRAKSRAPSSPSDWFR